MSEKQNAKALRAMLEKRRIIKEGASYNDIIGNNLLMKHIRETLANNLSKNPTTSYYGTGVISDWDLFFLCQTDANLSETISKMKNCDIDDNKKTDLKKKRNQLSRFISNLRDQIILDMDLVGTPDPDEKLTKKPRTEESVGKELSEREKRITDKWVNAGGPSGIGKRRVESGVIKPPKLISDEAQETMECDEEIYEEEEEEDEEQATSSFISSLDKKHKYLIRNYPNIQSTGIFFYVDTIDGLQQVCEASTELNQSFFNEVMNSKK